MWVKNKFSEFDNREKRKKTPMNQQQQQQQITLQQ